MQEQIDELHRLVGRKQAELENLRKKYEIIYEILAKVVSGELDRSRVLVNLTELNCTWCAIGERPALPATINGLPRCVVAPDKE